MKELLENANEFLESGKENLNKKRYNASLTDFFKAIVIFCDFLIYEQIRVLPKNHGQRFSLLKKHFPEIYSKISELFKLYTLSYNFKSKLNDVLEVKKYAYELKGFCENKKET